MFKPVGWAESCPYVKRGVASNVLVNNSSLKSAIQILFVGNGGLHLLDGHVLFPHQMNMKPFLILQARPEDAAADAEFQAILDKAGLSAKDVVRVRLEQEPPPVETLSDFSGIILGGGPGCVTDDPTKKSPDEARIEETIFSLLPMVTEQDFPFLGCCLGIGVLGHHLGNFVSKEAYSEPVGISACLVTKAGADDPLLRGVNPNFDAFVGHKEALQALPPECVQLVSSPNCPFQMIRFRDNVYATQFHPEADSEEFELRIRLYRDRGYFPPEDAERLIELCQSATVAQPEKILRNFVAIYKRD